MKLLVALCLVAVVAAAPQSRDAYSPGSVQVLQYEFDNLGLGPYSYRFQLSDGSRREEQGELRNAGKEDEFLAVKGVYSWVAPNSIRYTVKYVADDNGYQPEIEEGPGDASPLIATLLSG